MNVVLWDLDNCLSHDEWRIPRIDWAATDPDKRYAHYHDGCDEDHPGNKELFALHHAGGGAVAVFVTARPEGSREKTRRWLRSHFLAITPPRGLLLMRPPGDARPSVELKLALVQGMLRLEPGLQIEAAYDDREEIVAMYRKHFNVNAHVLALHSVCAYTPPQKGR